MFYPEVVLTLREFVEQQVSKVLQIEKNVVMASFEFYLIFWRSNDTKKVLFCLFASMTSFSKINGPNK